MEDLVEKAQEIEVTIPVIKSQKRRYILDPDRFWGKRPDVVAIIEALPIVYILELNGQRTGTRDFCIWKKHTQRAAQKHHHRFIGALLAAVETWKFEQTNVSH